MTEHPADDPGIVRHGDFLVNVETGEIVGLIGDELEPFRVTDRSSAEWVLERLSEAEAEVAAITKRREILYANLDAMERPARRRVDWLRLRFCGELEAFARAELEGQKTRSWRSPFGALSFRKVKARLKVDDEARALTWCRENLPAAVKVVESVLVSEVTPQVEDVAPPGFAIEAGSDSFSISTGVK